MPNSSHLKKSQFSLNLKDIAGNCTLFRDIEGIRLLVDDNKIELQVGGSGMRICGVDSYGSGTGLAVGYVEKYEGWNFNSGNYLFTTDTK